MFNESKEKWVWDRAHASLAAKLNVLIDERKTLTQVEIDYSLQELIKRIKRDIEAIK